MRGSKSSAFQILWRSSPFSAIKNQHLLGQAAAGLEQWLPGTWEEVMVD